MAKQIERIGIGLLCGVGQFIELNPPLCQRLDNFIAADGIGPFITEVSRIGEEGPNLDGGVVGVFDDLELLAVGV